MNAELMSSQDARLTLKYLNESRMLLDCLNIREPLEAIASGRVVCIDTQELDALKQDAARWRWLDSRTDHTWEKLSRMSHALTRGYIDRGIAQEKAK